MRLYCPQCLRKYNDVSFDTCPEDGARLYALTDKRDDPLLGTIVGDRFRIEELLSKGGMGAVYRATQLSVNRVVALKVLRPEMEDQELFLERFFREARVVAELSHPNIVRLIDFGQDHKTKLLFLVMELVRGTDMGDLLEKGRLKPALALEVVYQVCAGLTEPHSREIVHRDLKPDNIILLPISDGTFQVKILDFGIARTGEAGTKLTQTGMICGTPSYMSPEQAQNLKEMNARTDLYSLGVVLFEMLTGHLPFQADSGLQVLMNHIQRPPPKLIEAYPGMIPPAIGDLVSELLEKDPDQRPSSAMEVRRRVQAIRKELNLSPVVLNEGSSNHKDRADNQALFAPWILPGIESGQPRSPESQDTSDRHPISEALLPFAETNADTGPVDDWSETMEFADTKAASESAVPSTDQIGPSDDISPTDNIASADDKRSNQLHLGATIAAIIVALALLLYVVGGLISSVPAEDQEVVEEHSLIADEPVPDEASSPDDAIPDGATEEIIEEVVEVAMLTTEEAIATGEEPTVIDELPTVDEVDEVIPPDPTPSPSPPSVPVASAVPSAPSPEAPTPAPDPSPPSEPTSGPIYEGTVFLESPSQVPDALNYEEITGDLVVRINIDDYTHLELPNLNKVRGNLILDPLSKVVNISLPSLESIGGSLLTSQGTNLGNLNAPNLRSIDLNLLITATQISSFTLPRLRRVDGMVSLMNNSELTSIGFPALEHVGEGLSFMNNPKLQALTTTELRHIGEDLMVLSGQISTIMMERLETIGGGVTLNENEALEVLRMSRLTSIGMSSSRVANFSIIEAANLDELRLTSLREVKGNFILVSSPRLSRLNLSNLETVGDQLNLSNNESLERIDLDSLSTVGGRMIITAHPLLDRLSAGGLQSVDELMLMNNPRLSSCDVEKIVAALEATGWNGESRLINNLDEECSP